MINFIYFSFKWPPHNAVSHTQVQSLWLLVLRDWFWGEGAPILLAMWLIRCPWHDLNMSGLYLWTILSFSWQCAASSLEMTQYVESMWNSESFLASGGLYCQRSKKWEALLSVDKGRLIRVQLIPEKYFYFLFIMSSFLTEGSRPPVNAVPDFIIYRIDWYYWCT